MQGVVLFDVDGTLVKGFTMMRFGRFLVRHNLVSRRHWLKVLADYVAYRTGTISYAQFALDAMDNFAQTLAGLKQEQVLGAGEQLCRLRDNLYWYSNPLVSMFKEHGFLTVAISGSPEECFIPLHIRLGLDEFYGTVFEQDEKGVYTGKLSRNMAIHASKESVVNSLKDRADFSRSFAFGDTTEDLPLLEQVASPVAINPKAELLRVATSRGWPMLTYRQDVLGQVRTMLAGLSS